ncbi:hypothetical protein BCR33DRAFT_779027 [Rhizoclosmatium globosum]|uniref:DNA-dependent protein kinase catalytic subunit n=1 Tax=Rhizoclosmatium globosum TaxID=329046 RepID=A0A1Y2D3F1_9FUNG|nr:hypothetical protein BCR33DRAFT_779027 [Rhizoclosmatium globosum]|eukprot:ORY53674.1 hypothetical protein BCR33DRAFT_779027 [Rhizoclosmatium globosum]
MADLITQLEQLSSRPDIAEAAVVDLQNQIVRMHADRKPLAMSALFNKQQGILQLLRTNKDAFTSKAKYMMLDFIAELTTCWLFFSNSKELSAVKKSAVHVLVALVEEKLLDAATLEAMVKRFMTHFVQNQSKLVSSVKCAILELFGACVRYYPDSFTIDKQDPDQIKKRLLTTISSCINSANPDMELLAGAVLGLSSYLHSFEASAAESTEILSTIRKMIIPLENQTRYAVPRAGLIFIRDHAENFRNQLCSDRDTVLFIHSCLKSMCTHGNRDLQNDTAMTSFLQQVAQALTDRKLSPSEIEIFWYFVKEFINNLNKPETDQYAELSLAVRGLGLFATPCKVLLAEKELKELQGILVRKLSSLSSGSNDAKYAHISAFMDAFKMIVHESVKVDTELLNAIEELLTSMLLNFPKVREYYRKPLVSAFVELMWELNIHGLLWSFWGGIAKRLLIISCVDKEEDRTAGMDELVAESREPTWKDYLVFWETLFVAKNEAWDESKVHDFRSLLYDGMVTAILELPGNLNLSVRETGPDSDASTVVPISADASKLVADNAADFVIFVTYVSLVESLLPKIEVMFFDKWIYVVGQKFISYSTQNPLVSGFYKIFGVVLALSDSLKYFSVPTRNEQGMDYDSVEESSDVTKAARSLFSKYLDEVLLKMRQFKDDLLVSCLKMVLYSPVELTTIESLCLPIIESLKMGLSFTPLASVALDAIAVWSSKLDRKTLASSYAKILPSLNDYLLLDLEETASTVSGKKATSKARTKHLKTHKHKNEQMDEQIVQDLKSIQIRILKLLGSLGQDSRLMLSNETSASLLAWDTEMNLKVQIPFKEAIFDVYFDNMLPRIVELAENSPDRKTKVAANELLHALVIVMIGGSQSRSEGDGRTPYHKIYVKLFPVLLRLSVDLDKVTRELFRPLVIQLVHWLTKNSKYENPETMALLQSCFDAVSSSNGPLREFGAECIAEYLKWSIKHASEKELENNPINAKSLFKRLYLLCQHASSAKRLGASIIINRIYTIFRESNALVDVFTMEILYHLLFSLKISDRDNPALGTHALVKIAIDNMAKIVVVKHELFLATTSSRRSFPDLPNCNLGTVTRWLFEQSKHKELEYSYKCIELFDKFASRMTGVVSWMKNIQTNNERYVFDLFKLPVNTAVLDDCQKSLTWLLSLRTNLIMYRYLVDRGALTAQSIVLQSDIVTSIVTFLDAAADVETLNTAFKSLDAFNNNRAFVFLKVVEFVNSVFGKTLAVDKKHWSPIFECENFYRMLALTMFAPEKLGFDVGLDATKDEVSSRLVEVTTLLNRCLEQPFKMRLMNTFAEYLLSSDFDLRKTNIYSRRQTTLYLQVTNGLQSLRKCGILEAVLMAKSVSSRQYMALVLRSGITISKSSDLLQIQLARNMVWECICNNESQEDAFSLILNPPVSGTDDAMVNLKNLAPTVSHAVCSYPSSFIKSMREGVEASFAIVLIDNFLNWIETAESKSEVEIFVKHAIADSSFTTSIISFYYRTGEHSLTRFWRKFLKISSVTLAISEENALSQCFWSEFFLNFNHRSSLKALSDLFDLLPLVMVANKFQKLEESLSSIVVEKFPLVSELTEDSNEQMNDYRVCMNKLIEAMARCSNSAMVERILMLHMCRNPSHPFNESVMDCISAKASSVSFEVFDELTKYGFEFSVQSKNSHDLRWNAAKLLLLVTLQSCQLDNLVRFFVQYIREIMDNLAAAAPIGDESALLQYLVTKAICFMLLEVAYKRLPPSELHSAKGRILQAYVGPSKSGEKEITIALIKSGVDFKKKPAFEERSIASYRLIVNQTAFNAVAACLLATQNISKVEIFNSYLFVEKPCLWENIVDTSRPIEIETDLSAPLIRVGLKDFSEKVSMNRKYLSTQFLADSSLSQMSSLFGQKDARSRSLTQSSIPLLSQDFSSQNSDFDSNLSLAAASAVNDASNALEMDLLNENICMRGILSVIQRLSKPGADQEMSLWMKSLHGKMEKPDAHINVRLFIAKIIINVPNIFAPFAKYWWRPIAQLVQDADLFGSGINYFVQDLCLLLMEWTKNAHAVTKADDSVTILKTMRWLIRHCNHESKATIRNHLRIVRTLIENWKDFMIVPSDVIFELLHAKPDGNNKAEKYLNLTGVYVLQALVANKVSAYDARGLTDRIFSESDLLDSLSSLLTLSKLKEIYSPLAECIGTVLLFMETTLHNYHASFLSKIEDVCKKLQASEPKSFIVIINRISVHYPRILQNQYKVLFNLYPKLDLDLKGKSLEAILSWADAIPDLFTEILGLDLEDIFLSQDEECQTYVLGILSILAPTLSHSQTAKFLGLAVDLFSIHGSDRVRAAFFSMIFKLKESPAVEHDAVLKRLVKYSLLKGLSDSDNGIRSSLLEYFNSKVFVNQTVFDRAMDLVCDWYIPEVEDSFLKYSVLFLLDATRLTPMFDQKVYDRGLPDARFNDKDIVVDLLWKNSTSMLPLFAATQDKASFSFDEREGGIRATQEMVWTPTQDVDAKTTRIQFSRLQSEFDSQTQSSTQPFIDRRTLVRRSYASKVDSTYFAYGAERKKKEARNIETFKQAASQRSVTLYRKYREGELPDIEIKHKDVLEPLQSLANRDNEIARRLMTIILTKMTLDNTIDLEKLTQAINGVFKTSLMSSSPLIGSLLDIMLHNNGIIQGSSPSLISHVASATSNFELGALIIEKGLEDDLFLSADTKKLKTFNRAVRKSPEAWVSLAQLYKELQHIEVYESIYESRVAYSLVTKEAISAELLGDFETAKNKYLEGLGSENLDVSEAELQLWTTQRLECMNKLGEWSLLAASVLQDVDDNLNSLWEPENVDPYLKLFLRSHLKLREGRTLADDTFVPWSPADDNPIKKFLDEAKKDAKKRSVLELLFSDDLLTSAVIARDLNLARYFVDISWKQFVAAYAELNTSALVSRIDLLASLQHIYEFDEYLRILKLPGLASTKDEQLCSLFAGWRHRYPSATDSISVWDDVISGRKLMIEKVSAMLNNPPDQENNVYKFHQVIVSDDLLYSRRMAKAAAKQGLFSVADRWLDTANSRPGEFVPEFMQQYYKQTLLKSDRELGFANRFKPLENLLKHMDYYKKSIRETPNTVQLKFITLETRTLSRLLSLTHCLSANDSFFSDLGSNKGVTKFVGQRIQSKPELMQFFLDRAKHNILAIHALDVPSFRFQKGLIEVGMFVDKTLRCVEADEVSTKFMGHQPESAKVIIHSIFRAMSMGSLKAVEFFPRLLQILETYPEVANDFSVHSQDVPTWMYLRWLPQLTSLLDKVTGLTLLPLVQKISTKYPNALRFPFSISCEQYQFDAFNAPNAKLIERLKSSLQSAMHDKLAVELRRLEDPAHIFKDLCERFESLISSSLPAKQASIKKAYEEFKLICLETKKNGDIGRKFAEKHTAKIANICANGEKIDNNKLKELVSYRDKLGSEAESKPGKNLLKSFSLWLSEYQIGNYDPTEYLEVPGQYTGTSEPNISQHVLISNFDPNVLVMSSMRRPKKIIMIGSDEREYPWLVKGGEDLRLDQRIEQMFSIMNDMLVKNPFCSRNRVAVATYKVIPMSTSLGVIEWVDNTKPLKACMADSPQFDKKMAESQAEYSAFVVKFGKSGSGFGGAYEPFMMNATPRHVIENMQSIWNKNRSSYLREFFLKLTISAEAFFQIRGEFANSFAALSICSYLLGIGDRHLDNFLVNLKNGKIVGIDFGHAFGSATEVLPIPELVPFRLTNQIEKFLLPLGVQNLMVHPMTNTLAAIQEEKDGLINALNIFVNEPLIEWRKFAKLQMQRQGKGTVAISSMSDSLAAPEWYPRQKLEIARRKLDRENPIFITADELKNGHEKKKWYKNMRVTLMGDPVINIRAKAGNICQTPKEQVECLIDLAMDPNVLGRAWLGWSPFMFGLQFVIGLLILYKVVWSISLQKGIGCLTTADGNQIAATFGTEIALIDLINGKVLCSFDTSLTACIKQLHFDPKLSVFHTANEAVYVGLNSEGKEIGSYQSADKITDFINIPTSTTIIYLTYRSRQSPLKIAELAAITVLEEFMRNDDHGVMIGRDDGTVEIYTFPDFEVDSIQIPSLLLKKHVGERILSFIGWADDVSSDGALDTLLVSVFSGHIYAITMLPHGSTEMNSKELIQILQRAKEETTVIENQNLKSQKQRKGCLQCHRVNQNRSTLHIQTSTLTSLHIIHTQLTSLAAKYQTKTTVSTRLNFPHSITAHLGLLLPVLEQWKNQKNEQMLLEGLKAVDDFDSGFRDVVDDGWLQLLKGGIQGESNLKEEEVDMAQQELEKLFISSYALKGVSVEKKRSWFVGKVKEVIESGLSVDVLKKLFHNDGLS